MRIVYIKVYNSVMQGHYASKDFWPLLKEKCYKFEKYNLHDLFAVTILKWVTIDHVPQRISLHIKYYRQA